MRAFSFQAREKVEKGEGVEDIADPTGFLCAEGGEVEALVFLEKYSKKLAELLFVFRWQHKRSIAERGG